VTRLGRMAGQYGKPRSISAEVVGGATVPVYRGDAVNRPGGSAGEREADPLLLLEAHAQSRRVAEWLAAEASEGPGRDTFTSHEALLLNYEAALTRREPATGRSISLSAHSLWLGDRTRDPRGAHVEYLRGIANPIGIKCGPSMNPAQLLALLDRLDPHRTPGRIMLVARIGFAQVSTRLAPLMEAVHDAAHPALWLCDPMHGNNRSVDGCKTRLVPDIVAEVEQFAAVARRSGVRPGGLHLEVTPSPVLECVDDLAEATPGRRFDSRCDPRLNPDQASRVVQAFAAAIGGQA
jgi:3-deoxy-7-phosphoheptulonate synthase